VLIYIFKLNAFKKPLKLNLYAFLALSFFLMIFLAIFVSPRLGFFFLKEA